MAARKKKASAGRRLDKVGFSWLLPNLLTITALVCGTTAIRYALDGRFQGAVLLVLMAVVFDGLDGRMARLFKSSSTFGAHLDSLSDVIVFGVVPSVIMYLFIESESTRVVWTACLFYMICCVLRLARFNSELQRDNSDRPMNYFSGVPTPLAAILVLLPLIGSFRFDHPLWMSEFFILAWMLIVGVLAISNIPTFSLKHLKLSRFSAVFFLIVFALTLVAMITWTWATIIFLGVLYMLVIPISMRQFARDKAQLRAVKNK